MLPELKLVISACTKRLFKALIQLVAVELED